MEKIPHCIIDKAFDRKRAHDIAFEIDSKGCSLEVCEWGVRGLASIAGLAMTTHNSESMADFLDDGGCECLINMMNRYSEISQVVAAYGCMTVSILAWSLRELKEFLGEVGACETVVFALSMNIGDPEVSEYGTRAIAYLAKNDISNSFKLAEAEACDILAQAGNFGFNLRHEKAVIVAGNVCLAFSYLSEALNAKRLYECGASSLVCELTKLHFKNEEFAVTAVKAICALSSLNAIHREELGKVDVCKHLVSMLYLHNTNPQFILEGCESILHLTLSPTNSQRFSQEGACELVLSMLKTKLMDVDFGTEICSGAILNLVTYGTTAKSNREKFVNLGALDVLRKAQFSSKASYKARENISNLLELLGRESTLTASSSSSSLSTLNGINSHPVVVGNRSRQDSNSLISVIHGSEMKGSTIPLQVEVREVLQYDSFIRHHSPSPDVDIADSTHIVTSHPGIVEI